MPPLRALQAFEAAGRLGSFRAAAEELLVTHSAISHQIKALEAWLEAPLFVRGARAVSLTAGGRLLLPVLSEALDSIAAGAELASGRGAKGTLTVQVYITFAVKWLMPRLAAFQRERPDTGVAIATAIGSWGFSGDMADAGIVFEDEALEGVEVTPLYSGQLFPVCAPSLMKGDRPLERPSDLRHHTLLNVYTAPDNWPQWLAAAGVEGLAANQQASYDSFLLAQEAAMRGEGVAMALDLYVAPDLADGRLVRPFGASIPQAQPLCLVCPMHRARDPRIAGFRAWLLQEMAASAPTAT